MTSPLNEVEQLITSGKTNEALQVLIDSTSGRFKRKFRLLLNRLKSLEKRFHQGTLSENDYQTESNKISADLLFALQQYEQELEGVPKGMNEDSIKWAIVAGVVFIVGFLGLQFLSSSNCSGKVKTAIYVADFQKSNEDLFSKALVTSFRNKLHESEYKIGGVDYLDYELENYDGVVKRNYFDRECENKGVFLNGTWSRDDQYFNTYINFINLELLVPGLEGQETIILDSPDEISFSIKKDADFLSRLVLAILKVYEGFPYEALVRFREIEKNNDVIKGSSLSGYILFYKACAYAMRGNKDRANKNFNASFDALGILKPLALHNMNITEKVELIMLNDPGLKQILLDNLLQDSLLGITTSATKNTTYENENELLDSISNKIFLSSEILDEWQNIDKNDTLAIKEFIIDNVDNKKALETVNAIGTLEKIRELNDWKIVMDSPSLEVIIAFQAKYPRSAFANQAEVIIVKIKEEESFWVSQKNQNSSESYLKYIEKYPNGVFFKEALDSISSIEKEQQFFEEATSVGSRERLQSYTNNYPQGRFLDSINQLMADNYIDPIFSVVKGHRTILINGKVWLAQNLDISVSDSWCYEERPQNCNNFGRLYTWGAAQIACKKLGEFWRLPTDEEWQTLAQTYSKREIDIKGDKKSYDSLIKGGVSKFDVLLGGNRQINGKFQSLGRFGNFWTSSDKNEFNAYYYHFKSSNHRLFRLSNYKSTAFSCRCVKD